MKEYTPKIHEEGKYIEILIETDKCKCCDKRMIPEKGFKGLFPKALKINQEAQMKSAGIVYSTYTLVDDSPICIECETSGKADFLCALCEKRKKSNKKQESYGSPAEFMCSDCYETKPAKVWDEMSEKLYEDHEYDLY